ncbi:exo-alpha-sialidase [bacterium]|nr:exo-alpha-sialidase [bacterium]
MRSTLGLVIGLSLSAYLHLSAAERPVVIATEAGQQRPIQPQLAVSSDGTIHITYGVNDRVFYCQSKDGGTTFSQPQVACTCPNLSLGMRRGPRIAISQGVPVITAIGGPQGKGRDGDLQAWRLEPGQKSWTGPVTVNDASASAREGLHAMAAAPDGRVWCTWLDLRNKRTELMLSHSDDHGATWSANQLIYQNPEKSICECCHPSIAIGTDGTISILFRNSLSGQRDMYVTSSRDGSTFTPPAKLGQSSWQLDACPMDGGMLAVNEQAKIDTVWLREKQIYLTQGQGPERPLGPGEQPWIATTQHGPVVIWLTRRDGALQLLRPNATSPATIAAVARDPVIVAIPGTSRVAIAWEGRHQGQRVILLQMMDVGK